MSKKKQKVIIVGAGPVGCLAALYAASRGDEVEVYELRGGMLLFLFFLIFKIVAPFYGNIAALLFSSSFGSFFPLRTCHMR